MKHRVIALGLFDGVHIGHGALLTRTAEVAAACGASSCALTFSDHPARILGNTNARLINTVEERAALIHRLYRLDEVLVLPFDAAFCALPWDKFVTENLIEKWNACHVIAGFDYRFGTHGTGNADLLAALCAEHGIGCDIIPPVVLDGVKVSSTHIRTLLEHGDMREAARFLGHPYTIERPVREGYHLGRTLGLPTANQHYPTGLLVPAFGVYATDVWVGTQRFAGVTNVGIRPTVSESGTVTAETHILGFSGDLYGCTLRVEFLRQMRPERAFPDLSSLKTQIQTDIEMRREPAL